MLGKDLLAAQPPVAPDALDLGLFEFYRIKLRHWQAAEKLAIACGLANNRRRRNPFRVGGSHAPTQGSSATHRDPGLCYVTPSAYSEKRTTLSIIRRRRTGLEFFSSLLVLQSGHPAT